MLPSTITHKFLLVNNDSSDKPPDFSVVVSGDEMKPLLSEGDILLIKKQDFAEHGDLGIFLIYGVRHVKKMYFKDGYVCLTSLDTNCGNITLNDIHNLTCEGKVVKVLHSGECKFIEI